MENSGTRMQDLVRDSADGIVVVDAQGRVRFANPAAEVLLGFDPGDAIGFHLGYPVADQESFTLVLKKADGRESIVEMRSVETNWDGEPAFVINLRDTTERTRIDTERRSAQERAQRYFDVAGVLFVALDRAGTVVDVNPCGLRTLAAARSEILGRDWVETFVPVDEQESTREAFQGLLAGKPDSTLPFEGRVVRADGEQRVVSWHASVIRDDDGTIAGVLLSGEDITELRAAELLSARYRDIVEKMPVGVHVYHLEDRENDGTLRMIAVNPAAERFTGVSAEEAVGQTLDKSFPRLRSQGVPQIYAEVVRTGRARDLGEIQYEDDRVEANWFAVRIFPLPGDCVAASFDRVTERKRAEGLAREADLRLREAVSGGNVGLWDWDLVKDKVAFSREWKAQLGCREEEIGDDFEELKSRVHPEDLAPKMKALARALHSDGRSYRAVFRMRHRNGSYRWMLAQATVVRDESGTALRLMGSHVDITERKEAEVALEDSRRKLQSLFDNMNEGFALHEIVTDESGKPIDYRFLEINAAFKELTGLDDDVVGRLVTSVLPGIVDLEFDWIGTYGRVALTGEPIEFDQFFGPHDQWYRISSFCPSPRTFAVVFRDVTSERAAQAALVEALEKAEGRKAEAEGLLNGARSVLENLSFEEAASRILDSCRRFTGATVGSLTLLEESNSETAVFHIGPEGLLCAMDPDKGPCPRGLRGEAYESGRAVFDNDHRSCPDHPGPSGRPMALRNVLFAPLYLEGRAVGMIGLGNKGADFTDRDAAIASGMAEIAAVALKNDRARKSLMEYEAQLRQAQKMEAVGRLAGGVAHDFNNLLMAIQGHCEIMRRRLRGEDPLADNLAQIKACGERAAGLTRQLLAFSRRQPLDPKVVDVTARLLDIEKMLRRLIGEDIRLVLECAPDLGRVRVDPGQLDQVIMNLVVNARDSMPDGGTLSIRAANVDQVGLRERVPGGASPASLVVITVSDDGCGMDGETLKHLFEPFFTTKPVGKGTGLGLSTVYGIVKQSGGDIHVQSEPGAGTTFQIWLPRVEAEPSAEVRKDTPGLRVGAGQHILVVEDEDALRELFECVLEDLDYRVTLAANGGEALIAVEEAGLRPDLLITDMVMPGMSGAVLVSRLYRTLPALKVLYMSGYTNGAIEGRGLLTSDAPFLQKPFDLDTLAMTVSKLLA